VIFSFLTPFFPLQRWSVQPPLLLSCKLTHAALRYLERRGEDLEPLYERFDWPLHYLRDSSSWLEADRLEYVLTALEELYGARVLAETGNSFFEAVAYASPQLRAWGALDSVLRIVPGVRELYHQPDRFLGSFISPQPMIQGLSHTSEKTVFRIDFSDDRMPRTAKYLRAALESLPEYIGKPRSHVTWSHGHVSIEWSDRQVPFVPMTLQTETPSLSPELLRTILVDLANAQRELDLTRRALQERDAELATLTASRKEDQSDDRIKLALHEIYKLGDYFARAQQIVTLLRSTSTRAAGTLVSSSSEAMVRRTAWDRVATEAPLAIRRAAKLLQGEVIDDAPADYSNFATDADKPKTNPRTPSFFDS
jgi:hypothetical protein